MLTAGYTLKGMSEKQGREKTEEHKGKGKGVLIGDKLEALLERTGISDRELARRIGVSATAVYKWKKNLAGISWEHLEKLAAAFGLPTFYFTGEKPLPAEKWVSIPVFERVGAGIWQGSEATPVEFIDVPIEMIKRKGVPPERVIGIKVVGNSMEPEIKSGDIVLVADPSYLRPKNGDKVVAWLNGEGVVKIYKEIDEGVLLMSANPAYYGENREIFIPKPKLKEVVVAKVIGLYRSY